MFLTIKQSERERMTFSYQFSCLSFDLNFLLIAFLLGTGSESQNLYNRVPYSEFSSAVTLYKVSNFHLVISKILLTVFDFQDLYKKKIYVHVHTPICICMCVDRQNMLHSKFLFTYFERQNRNYVLLFQKYSTVVSSSIIDTHYNAVQKAWHQNQIN